MGCAEKIYEGIGKEAGAKSGLTEFVAGIRKVHYFLEREFLDDGTKKLRRKS